MKLPDCFRRCPAILLAPFIVFGLYKLMVSSRTTEFVSNRDSGAVENLAAVDLRRLAVECPPPNPVREGPQTKQRSGSSGLSKYDAILCDEDMEHIKEITDTDYNIEGHDKLVNIFYGSVMKPIQMACERMARIGKKLIRAGYRME